MKSITKWLFPHITREGDLALEGSYYTSNNKRDDGPSCYVTLNKKEAAKLRDLLNSYIAGDGDAVIMWDGGVPR